MLERALALLDCHQLEADNLTWGSLRENWKIRFGDNGDLGIATDCRCVGHQHNGGTVARNLDRALAAGIGRKISRGFTDCLTLQPVAGGIRGCRDGVLCLGESVPGGVVEEISMRSANYSYGG